MRGSWPWRSSSNAATSPATPPPTMITRLGTCGIDSRPSDGVFRTSAGTWSAISGGSSVETSAGSSFTASGCSNAAHLLVWSLSRARSQRSVRMRSPGPPEKRYRTSANVSGWRGQVEMGFGKFPLEPPGAKIGQGVPAPGTRPGHPSAPGRRISRMARHKTVADAMWEMLAGAGVRRCYGIVGDARNPVIDALRRNGQVDFVHLRHEEAGVFAAVADASLTRSPVAVCGTAGPGATHLLHGLSDARKEGAPVIAIAGDTPTSKIDTGALEEVDPHLLFQVASLYTGRLVNPAQTRAVVQTAIRTALSDNGPTVIAVPGDVAAAEAPDGTFQAVSHHDPVLRPSGPDLEALASMLDAADTVTIFGGDGCRDAHHEVVALAEKLKAPVGYSLRGKQWLEWGNPYAAGMTGLLGWGGAYKAMHECGVCLMLGTDFPFTDFLPDKPKKVQVDRWPAHLGRRTHVDPRL